MPETNNIFEDPRSKLRGDNVQSKESVVRSEELPAAEEDWYLKRKPVVSHVGITKEDNKKDGHG